MLVMVVKMKVLVMTIDKILKKMSEIIGTLSYMQILNSAFFVNLSLQVTDDTGITSANSLVGDLKILRKGLTIAIMYTPL